MNIQEEFDKLDFRKCLGLGAFLAALYWLIFFDSGSALDTQINSQREKINQSQVKLKNILEALDDQKKFERELKEISQNMKDFKAYFEKSVEMNDVQAQVSEFAEKNGLLLNKLTKGENRKAEFDDYKETAVKFEIEGPFHNIMEFIAQLTTLNNAINFDTMSFTSEVAGDFPIVKLETTLVVYSTDESSPGGV